MTEAEVKEKLKSTDPGEIESALSMGNKWEGMAPVLDLFQSIWKMTYANTSDPEFIEFQQGSLAQKMALMNEQGGLIPSELTSVEEVTQLDLGGFAESMLFPELIRYRKLQRLDLWENKLSALPDEFFGLNHLKELYISCNLKEISPLIKEFKQLKILALPGNEIEQIPNSIRLLSSLEELDLSNNSLHMLPDFLQKLPNLKKLVVSGNPNLVVTSHQKESYAGKGIEFIG